MVQLIELIVVAAPVAGSIAGVGLIAWAVFAQSQRRLEALLTGLALAVGSAAFIWWFWSQILAED